LDSLRSKTILYGSVLLLLLELVPFAKSFLLLAPLPQTNHDQELIKTLQKEASLYRLHPNLFYTERLGNSFDLNAAGYYKIFSTNGYSPLILGTYADFYQTAMYEGEMSDVFGTNQMPPFYEYEKTGINFLNIKYFYGNSDLPFLENPRWKIAYENRSRYFKLVENSEVLPRFYPVYASVMTRDKDGARKILGDLRFDYSRKVVLSNQAAGTGENVTGCASVAPGTVKVNSYTNNTIDLSVDLPCNAYLVSSELMYPGWTASVDGVKSDVLTGNLAFRTLFVPSGKHTVRYAFVPVIFYLGAALSIMSLSVCTYVLIKNRGRT
jgi:hypothetical protein